MGGGVGEWIDGLDEAVCFLAPVLGEMVFIIIKMISSAQGGNQSACEKQTDCHWILEMNWLAGLYLNG